MNSVEREKLLIRFETADRWLTRVYDVNLRSPAHRAAIYSFVTKHYPDPRVSRIIEITYTYDEHLARRHGRN